MNSTLSKKNNTSHGNKHENHNDDKHTDKPDKHKDKPDKHKDKHTDKPDKQEKKTTIWDEIKTGFIIALIIVMGWWIYCLIVYRTSQLRLNIYATAAYKKYNKVPNLYISENFSIDITSVNFIEGLYYFELTKTDNKGILTVSNLVINSNEVGQPPLKMSSLQNRIQAHIKDSFNENITLIIPRSYLPLPKEGETYWDTDNAVYISPTTDDGKPLLQAQMYLLKAENMQKLVYSDISYNVIVPCLTTDTNCTEL